MSNFIIYHNPRCSKSRQALEILNKKNITYKIFLYLSEELEKNQIKNLLSKLEISPRELLRKNEIDFKDNNLSNSSIGDEEIIEMMIQFPKLIQRPILDNGKRAIIGRPPEKILELL
ncbi:arsenate reductase (glutaredoxin) [Gammaproteobacteria bacterium]|jgi:arsenate reductase|nr:arsenate reductase (glutaredoxin) [Gammaproteobacteria bacterium]